jgi:serine/threonine protein phosphatase 1
MSPVRRFSRAPAGRDFAVGDIHGQFGRLDAALAAAGFDPARDRLFSVGDMVDRGPGSHLAEEWLGRPWFHAVRGNHEDMAIRWARGNPMRQDLYESHGGRWFIDLPKEDQRRMGARFEALPVAIEVETAAGLVGIVHADCPRKDWGHLVNDLTSELPSAWRPATDACMWSRDRHSRMDCSGVQGVAAVVVGHTVVPAPTLLGNVWMIDTGAWKPEAGHGFVLLDLGTLELVPEQQPQRWGAP